MTRFVVVSLFVLSISACTSAHVTPLTGEDPEVVALLGAGPSDDPSVSALAAARRLHQALVQDDTQMVWTLLSANTQKALDERGAAIATNGRELIDRSTLPGPNGTLRTVRYETIFFVAHLSDLREAAPSPTNAAPGTKHDVLAVAEDGTTNNISFVREADGWKLDKTGF